MGGVAVAFWYRSKAAAAVANAKVDGVVAKGLSVTLVAKAAELDNAHAALGEARRRAIAGEQEYRRRVDDMHEQMDAILAGFGDAASSATAVRAELRKLLRSTREGDGASQPAGADGTSLPLQPA